MWHLSWILKNKNEPVEWKARGRHRPAGGLRTEGRPVREIERGIGWVWKNRPLEVIPGLGEECVFCSKSNRKPLKGRSRGWTEAHTGCGDKSGLEREEQKQEVKSFVVTWEREGAGLAYGGIEKMKRSRVLWEFFFGRKKNGIDGGLQGGHKEKGETKEDLNFLTWVTGQMV